MLCRKCYEELDEDNISIEIAAHDDELLDIIIECPACAHKVNNFVHISDFVDLD